MATVTELLDRACYVSGLRTTGSERTLVKQALNDAYLNVVMDSECYEESATKTVSSSADIYDLSSDFSLGPTELLKIKNIVFTQGTQALYPLKHVSENEFNEWRNGYGAAGTPMVYCIIGTNKIGFWPQPGANSSFKIRYVKTPPTLVESAPGAGEEITPSKVFSAFHWNTLLPLTVAQALEKDQRIQDAMYWRGQYQEGLLKLKMYVDTFGGEASPMHIMDRMGYTSYPDQTGSR